MVKLDGLRWRPLCSFAGAIHKRFLSIFSFALMHVLRLSGIHHFALFNCFTFKDHVADFNDYCFINDSLIFKFSFDVKNFYTEINKDLLLYRVRFVLQAYRDRHHVNFISFPKKKDKIQKPVAGFSTNPKYYCISLDDLLLVIKIALDFAYYGLGIHIIHQIVGLAMGCPLSPPLAILYLAFDEHMSCLPDYTRLYRCYKLRFLLERYMDDLILLIAISAHMSTAKPVADAVAHYVQFNMYDQISGLLTLKRVEEDVFLDTFVSISDNFKSIKCIYHNKNAGMTAAISQKVGRFFSSSAPVDPATKGSAPLCICVRLHDLTTEAPDMVPVLADLSNELQLLGFSTHFVRSLFIRANRSRPCYVWKAASIVLSSLLLSA
jgi:hypothetical protein